MEPLPFIDEHGEPVDAPAEAVWEALSKLLRRKMGSAAWFARLLGCEPAVGTEDFAGRPGSRRRSREACSPRRC